MGQLKDVLMFYHFSSSMKSSRPSINTQYQHLTSVHCYVLNPAWSLRRRVCRLRPRQWSTFSSLQTARRLANWHFHRLSSVCLSASSGSHGGLEVKRAPLYSLFCYCCYWSEITKDVRPQRQWTAKRFEDIAR